MQETFDGLIHISAVMFPVRSNAAASGAWKYDDPFNVAYKSMSPVPDACTGVAAGATTAQTIVATNVDTTMRAASRVNERRVGMAEKCVPIKRQANHT